MLLNHLKAKPSQGETISRRNHLRAERPSLQPPLVSDLAEELEADEADFRLVVVVAEVFHRGFEGV